MEDQPYEGGNRRFDVAVEASWQGKIARFAVECKALSTPKAFRDGLNMLKSSPLPKGWRAMLLLPFLSERQLLELEREGIEDDVPYRGYKSYESWANALEDSERPHHFSREGRLEN